MTKVNMYNYHVYIVTIIYMPVYITNYSNTYCMERGPLATMMSYSTVNKFTQ